VNDGDFSVKHSFANYGSNQVILRLDTNSSIIPASFNLIIPSYQSTPSSPFPVNSDRSNLDKDNTSTESFTTYLIIGIGVAVSIGMTIILLSIIKKNNSCPL
jgi:hypothetical protein